jgi:4-amino-4-deoxy-L-arabinose transferase-like glycosyltransferase
LGHHKPIWYFLGVLPVDFLPWSFLVPSALLATRSLDDRQRRHALLLVCWVVTTVVFFSLSPGKRTVYILTMYPALAVLVGAGLAALSRAVERSRGWLAWPTGALALLFWTLTVAAPVAARRPDAPPFAASLVTPVTVALGVVATAMTVACALALLRRVAPAIAAIAIGLAAPATALFVSVLPRLNPELSQRELAERVRRDLPDGFELASWHEMEGGLLFYGSGYARELNDEEELSAYLARPRDAWLVVDPDEEGFEPPAGLEVVARQGRREDGVRIFGWSRPAAPTAPR